MQVEDLADMCKVVSNKVTPFSKLSSMGILDRVLESAQLPETQIDLLGLLATSSNRAKIYIGSSQIEGGIAMYYGLGSVWSKLGISESSTDLD